MYAKFVEVRRIKHEIIVERAMVVKVLPIARLVEPGQGGGNEQTNRSGGLGGVTPSFRSTRVLALRMVPGWRARIIERTMPRVASAVLVEEPNAARCIDFTFAGHTFAFHDPNGADMVARTMQTRSYEAPLPIILMAAVTRSQGLFLDVGANNGLYSILATKTRPDAGVVAFEPYAPARDVFLANLVLNGVEANVVVHDVALSDSTGKATLHVPDSSHGLLETSASLEPDFQSAAQTVTVYKTRLDDITLDGRIAIMKIDVEGHEAAVMRGAVRRLEQDRPIVFAEMLPGAEPHFPFMTGLFARLDYLMFRLRPDCAIRADVIRFDPLAWNYACVPRTALAIFRECCTTHGVEVLAPA